MNVLVIRVNKCYSNSTAAFLKLQCACMCIQPADFATSAASDSVSLQGPGKLDVADARSAL